MTRRKRGGEGLQPYMGSSILNAIDYSVRWGGGGQHDWHTFSRPHVPLAPSISHSTSALSIPLHRPTTVLLAFLSPQ